MADGEVLINTKIDTSGAKEDLKKLKQELSASADTASASAQKIDDSFEKVDVSGAAEGLGESFEKEADKAERAVEELAQELPESYRTIYQKISQIQADGSLSNQDKVDKIREQYELLGQDQETAMRKAWDAVKYDSETGSRKVIENLQDIAKSASDTGESVEKKVGDAFGNLVKKIGGGLAAAFAVDKIVDFGKAALELGSDLEEVQNVVDVTFTTMSDKVNAFARDAASMAGLSETMAKQFAGTFGAMADSFGFAEREAYEMSTTLTKLAGDVASFYNLDQQEAFNKLKAIFTGETEALKELGVVMTRTALDAYAMEEGFGKVTSQMTEQEKVALRYQFVLGQLESASGDFMRTQDSWANQTRILTLQWESFQATVGEGLIYAFSPAIQYINDTVMPTLQNMADGFAEAMKPTAAEELRDRLGALGDTFEDAKEQFEETAVKIEANAVMAKACADELAKLESTGLKTTEAQEKYESVVKRLNALLPELNLKIDRHTGLVKGDTAALYDNIEALSAQMEIRAQQEIYNELQEEYKDAAKELYEAEYELYTLENERVGIIQEIASEMGIAYEDAELLANGYAEMNEELSLSDVLYKELYSVLLYLNPATDDLIEKILRNKDEQGALNAEIENAKTKLDEAYTSLDNYSQKLENSVESAEIAAGGQTTITEATEITVQTVEQLREEYEAARDAARDSIDQQISMFDQLNAASEKSAGQIIADAKKTVGTYQDYARNLQGLIDRGLPRELAAQWGDGSEESIQAVAAFSQASQAELEELISTWESFSDVKDQYATVLADIQTGTSEKLDEISRNFEETFDEIPLDLRESMDLCVVELDRLKDKTIYVDVVFRPKEQSSGLPNVYWESIQNTLSTPSYGNIEYNAASYIPYLAEGAVIPPNAPFAAVLGDQRHGYNLEGPEDMFRGIVREEIAGVLGDFADGFDDLLGVSRDILSAIEGIEVGDSTIGQANERYVDKMRIVRGR